jgi:hypothetical protein
LSHYLSRNLASSLIPPYEDLWMQCRTVLWQLSHLLTDF